jgi:hypothetical protein
VWPESDTPDFLSAQEPSIAIAAEQRASQCATSGKMQAGSTIVARAGKKSPKSCVPPEFGHTGVHLIASSLPRWNGAWSETLLNPKWPS